MNNKNNGNLFELIGVEDFKYEINSICKEFGLEKFTQEELIALYADYKDPKKPGNKFVEFMEGCFGPRFNKRTVNNDPLKEPTDRISKMLDRLGETPQWAVTSTFNPMGLEAIINEVQDLLSYKKTNKPNKEKCAEPTKQKPKEKDPTEDIERIIQEAMNNMDEKSFKVVNSKETVREKAIKEKKKEQSKEHVKETPVKKNTKIIPPSFEEIKKQLDYAVLNINKESRPGAAYETGVEAALKWVVGLSENKPLVDNLREFIVVDLKSIDKIIRAFECIDKSDLRLSGIEFIKKDGALGVSFDCYDFGGWKFRNGNILLLDNAGMVTKYFLDPEEFEKQCVVYSMNADRLGGVCYVKK